MNEKKKQKRTEWFRSQIDTLSEKSQRQMNGKTILFANSKTFAMHTGKRFHTIFPSGFVLNYFNPCIVFMYAYEFDGRCTIEPLLMQAQMIEQVTGYELPDHPIDFVGDGIALAKILKYAGYNVLFVEKFPDTLSRIRDIEEHYLDALHMAADNKDECMKAMQQATDPKERSRLNARVGMFNNWLKHIERLANMMYLPKSVKQTQESTSYDCTKDIIKHFERSLDGVI